MSAKGKKAEPPSPQSLNLPKMPNGTEASIRVRRMGSLGKETGSLKNKNALKEKKLELKKYSNAPYQVKKTVFTPISPR